MKKIIILCLLWPLSQASTTVAGDLAPAIQSLEQGDTEGAISLFEAQSEDPNAQLYLARIYLGSDLDTAEGWIEKAITSLPENPEAHYVRANISCVQAQNASMFSAMGYARKCKSSYEKAVELAPDNIEYLNGLMGYHLNAPAIAGGDKEQARALRDRIGDLDKRAGLQAQIDYYWAEESHEDVIAVIERATKAYDDLPDFFYVAGLYYLEQEDFPAAFRYFQTASVKDATTEFSELAKYGAIYQIGRTALFSEQQIDAGITALELYIESAPDRPGLPDQHWANLRLAGLYALADRKPEAKSIYTALAQAKDDEVRKRARKSLKQL